MGGPEVLWSREGHSPFMWWPGWSPNGRRLVTAEMKAPTMTVVVDGDTGEETARLKNHTRSVNACSWSPDGKLFATAGGDGRVYVYGSRGGRKGMHHLFSNHSESVDWAPDGSTLAVSSRDGLVLVMDPLSGKVVYSWPPGPIVLRVAWHPEGKVLAVAREDARVLLLTPQEEGSVLLVHRRGVSDLAWSPDGHRLATASEDGSVRVWSSEGTLLDMPKHPGREGAASVSWSPDGNRLAAASWDGAVRVWFEGILEVEDREGHGPPIAVAWRPEAKAQLLVGRSKGPLRLLGI
jgi:WD40 repeat protein